MDQTVESPETRAKGARELTDTLRRDGFVLFPKFLPVADVERARAEIEALYERDLDERRARSITDYHHDGGAGHSILTRPTHLLLDLYGKSPALDGLCERILTDPVSSAVLE